MELMVVVAIGAILASIAVPSFSDLINSTTQTSTMTQLVSDLNRARSEAIKRNQRVLICVRNAAGTDCGTGTDWKNGWLVCYDPDGSGACDTTAPVDGSAANPIAIHQAISAKLTLTGSASAIRFNPNGTQGAAGAAALTLNGSWTGATAKVVNIAVTGFISKP
jgi:type IV fimbrial biogenesis protein FimT